MNGRMIKLDMWIVDVEKHETKSARDLVKIHRPWNLSCDVNGSDDVPTLPACFHKM